MQYRPLGNTGVMVSFLGFSARYLPDPCDRELCEELISYACERGINFFDVSPYTYEGRAETILGTAVQELRRQGQSCLLSSQTGAETELEFWHDLEASLKRLKTDTIDLYHVWRVRSREDWDHRSERGVLKALTRAKEEGLIRYSGFSTFKGDYDLFPILKEAEIDVVSLGYSGLDFPFHKSNSELIKETRKGITVMNPFCYNPSVMNTNDFHFLKIKPEESFEESELRFFMANDDINVLITPFNTRSDIDHMEKSLEKYEHYSPEDIKILRENMKKDYGGFYKRICELDNYPENLEMNRIAAALENVGRS